MQAPEGQHDMAAAAPTPVIASSGAHEAAQALTGSAAGVGAEGAGAALGAIGPQERPAEAALPLSGVAPAKASLRAVCGVLLTSVLLSRAWYAACEPYRPGLDAGSSSGAPRNPLEAPPAKRARKIALSHLGDDEDEGVEDF